MDKTKENYKWVYRHIDQHTCSHERVFRSNLMNNDIRGQYYAPSLSAKLALIELLIWLSNPCSSIRFGSWAVSVVGRLACVTCHPHKCQDPWFPCGIFLYNEMLNVNHFIYQWWQAWRPPPRWKTQVTFDSATQDVFFQVKLHKFLDGRAIEDIRNGRR